MQLTEEELEYQRAKEKAREEGELRKFQQRQSAVAKMLETPPEYNRAERRKIAKKNKGRYKRPISLIPLEDVTIYD